MVKKFSALNELHDDALESIAGGAISLTSGDSKKKEDTGDIAAAMAAVDLSEVEIPGETDASASASVNGLEAKASASASVGYSETGDLGNGVTVTVYAGVGAEATAHVGPTGADAEATVTAGVGAEYDLGKGVTVNTDLQASAGVGVEVGMVNGNVVAGGAVSADVNATVGQSYESEEFGDGAKVTQDASISAGAAATAGGGISIGEDGVKTGYDTSAGMYVTAEANAGIGNDEYETEVGVKAVSPGSVSVGTDFSCGMEDGQLSVSVSTEMAVLLGGIGLEVNVGVQLFDSTTTVGTPQEIEAAMAELLEHIQTEDEQLTDQWESAMIGSLNTLYDEWKTVSGQLEKAQDTLDAIEEARLPYAANVDNLAKLVTLQDQLEAQGVQWGEAYWDDMLTVSIATLNQYDESHAPKIAELEGKIATYEESMSQLEEARDETRAQLEIAKQSDPDNIKALNGKVLEAQYNYAVFVQSNQGEYNQATKELLELADERQSLSENLAALKYLAGDTSVTPGVDMIDEDVREYIDTYAQRAESDPDWLANHLSAARHKLANWDAKYSDDVAEAQGVIQGLNSQYQNLYEKYTGLQDDLKEAQESTFMTLCAEAEASVVQAQSDLTKAENKVATLESDLSSHSELSAKEDQLTERMESLARIEAKASNYVEHLQSELEKENLDEPLRDEYTASLSSYQAFLAGEISSDQVTGELHRFADRAENLQIMIERETAAIDEVKEVIASKSAALEQAREDLAHAQEALVVATEEAKEDNPVTAARARADDAKEYLKEISAKLSATEKGSEEHKTIFAQYRSQTAVYEALDKAADKIEDSFERAQVGFELKEEVLTRKYTNLTQLVSKSGVLSTVANAAEDAWEDTGDFLGLW